MSLYDRVCQEGSDVEPVVYCDMDGVLTDLFGAVGAITGETYDSNFPAMKALVKLRRSPEFRDDPDFAVSFWENLPWTKNGKKLWSAILPYKPLILTGAIKGIGAEQGKRKWAARELGYSPGQVIMSRTKGDYAGDGNVLIDDSRKNIAEWEASGGVGILHKDSAYRDTLRKLKRVIKGG